MHKRGIEWVAKTTPMRTPNMAPVSPSRWRQNSNGRGSVEEYLEQTAIANPHTRIHFQGPDGNERLLERANHELPRSLKRLNLIHMGRTWPPCHAASRAAKMTLSQFLNQSFSRVSPTTARKLCNAADLSTRVNTGKLGRGEADASTRQFSQLEFLHPLQIALCLLVSRGFWLGFIRLCRENSLLLQHDHRESIEEILCYRSCSSVRRCCRCTKSLA